jgi:hypothetical protein
MTGNVKRQPSLGNACVKAHPRSSLELLPSSTWKITLVCRNFDIKTFSEMFYVKK